MTLASFQLTEPLVTAMVSLLSQNLNTTIDQLNATTTDGYTVPHIAQYLPYVPVPSTLAGGLPAIGVQELGSRFENDIVTTADALHRYAVVAIMQSADHLTLTWQLRRVMQAIAFTLQADRLAGTATGSGGIMRSQGLAWSVNLIEVQPGPLLGDLDVTDPEAPPRAYLSWTALVLESMRGEQPGF